MHDGKNYFIRIYICFHGMKQGWRGGCRRIINLDGCFLKSYCQGELLCAIGRDANNVIFQISWEVVCVENKDNWKWFIDNLTEDLNLQDGGFGVVLISDQHKIWYLFVNLLQCKDNIWYVILNSYIIDTYLGID